jgi:rhodanese-related sulfurtransferase
MELLSLLLAGFALLVAFVALLTAKGLRTTALDAASDARRESRNVGEEVERTLDVQRRLLARIAAGETVDRDMVLEGRLWDDATAEAGKALLESHPDLVILDVRTADETRHGVIPGARLIPIDQLEARMGEVPRGEQPMLVYCAAGSRSAAACEFLTQKGFEGLHNLEGGFSSWSGPTAPSPG